MKKTFIKNNASRFLRYFFTVVLSAYAFTVFSEESSEGPSEKAFIIKQASEIKLSGDKIKTLLLYGDPSKAGLYIMRIRFPAGTSSKPHFHDQDRFITVIEGVWHVGTNENYDMSDTTAITTGGFMMHPAGKIHYDGAKKEAVTVEIRGIGPVKTTSVYNP